MINPKQTITIDELRSLPVVVPEHAGGRWQSLVFHEVVKVATEVSGAETSPTMFVNRLNTDLIFSVPLPGNDAPVGCTWSLGVHASNSWRVTPALTLYLGVRVVDNTSVVFYEAPIRDVRSANFDLGASFREAWGLLSKDRCMSTAIALKAKPIDMRDTNLLLMEAGRSGLLPWSRVGRVDQLFRNTHHDGWDNKSAWCLACAFGRIVRMQPVDEQLSACLAFRRLLIDDAPQDS